jgi:hypothetical protein
VAGAGPGARFAFVQFEFAFPLGPADGRYLTRAAPDAEPERVLVLGTTGAAPRPLIGRRRPRRAEGESAAPEPVPVVRATVIRTDAFDDESAAEQWLDELRRDADALAAEAAGAAGELNALLRAHRAAAADPATRDVAPAGANAVRVGYGSGEQVADGRFAAAYELPPGQATSAAVRRRASALAPDERLAAILGGREDVLACEELVLRARADVDSGRPREAALQARIALEALLHELNPQDDALEADREPIGRAANAALTTDPPDELNEVVAACVVRMETALRRRRIQPSA